jgi:SAM-dependent methyltransferase
MQNPPKPAQLTPENAAAFQLPGVVAAYHLRTPYPAALARCLLNLMTPPGGKVLELGCGTGELTRMVAPRAERVDAIDVSAPMLDRARTLSAGHDENVRWIHDSAEEATLDGPYSLAIAGDSLHWMTWDVVLPRLRTALGHGAPLAIVSAQIETPRWSSELLDIIRRYSVMQDFEPYVLVDELRSRRLFEPLGETTIGPEPFERTVDQYIAALHATSGLASERMPPDDVDAFDQVVRDLVTPFAEGGVLRLGASASVTWGTPDP